MKLCAPWTEKDLTALAARLGELERKMEEGVPAAITQATPTEKPKEKPKPKRRPPALPEDRKEVQEKWALLRNDVEDAVLKGMLSKVEIGFKEDEFLYLICAYPALTDMIQRGMDKIAAVLEKETGKSFELRTTTKDEYEKWREGIRQGGGDTLCGGGCGICKPSGAVFPGGGCGMTLARRRNFR